MNVLESIEIETGANPRFSVVWLHGLGADGHDFEPIVPELVRRQWPAIRFVFPHAPQRAITINSGMRMRAWYDIYGLELTQKQDEVGITQSMDQITALLDRETGRGVPPQRQFLIGFSQGGAIALTTAIRRQQPLAATIALSTYLPLQGKSATEITAIGQQIPIFMGHGIADPIVGYQLGVISRDWLQRHNFNVRWREYPMPHSVCPDEIRDIADFMQPILLAAD